MGLGGEGEYEKNYSGSKYYEKTSKCLQILLSKFVKEERYQIIQKSQQTQFGRCLPRRNSQQHSQQHSVCQLPAFESSSGLPTIAVNLTSGTYDISLFRISDILVLLNSSFIDDIKLSSQVVDRI